MRRRSGRSGSRRSSIPNLSGLTRSQAIAAIQSAGFRYSESEEETNDSGLNSLIRSQSFSAGTIAPLGSTIPFTYYNYVAPAPVITYGPCESYGSGTNIGTGTQCNGTYTETYTDYSYSTRKKVYSDGVWDGISYSTLGCSPTTTRSITGSSQVNGQCGYVSPPVITYGPCEAYGSGTNIGSGTQCNGTYTESYTDYRYNTRKKVYSDGVWDGSSYSTSGCGTTDVRSVTSSSQVDGSCGYTAPVTVTYGPCEAYGSGTEIGSGSQCSGNYYQTYTDYRYNTRKKIYLNGSWDGSSYTTSGCGTTDSRSITGSSQVDGLCGYTAPATITYGSCQAYGDAIGDAPVGSGSYCSGTYTVSYQTWQFYARRTVLVNGSWDGYSYDYNCGITTQNIVVSNTQVNGSCGYTAPPPSVTYYCTESFNGGGVGNCNYSTSSTDTSYTNTSYSSRSCSTSGYPSCLSTNPAPVCTSYLYQCKSYDVTNSASTNYYDCYSVGACTAPRNPDGSRAQCCASYA